MHDFYVNAGLWASDGSWLKNVPMKVDPKVAYSRLPADLLRELGWPVIDPNRPRILSDGSLGTMAMGQVKIQLNDTARHTMVVFEEHDCQPVLGSHTLHSFALKFDPVHHELKPEMLRRPTIVPTCDDLVEEEDGRRPVNHTLIPVMPHR